MAAIRSFWTTSTSRPAAIFPTPTRTSNWRTSSISTARWRSGSPTANPVRASARGCAASPSAISTWRRSSTTSGATRQLLKIVLHTPVEVDLLAACRASLDWIDVQRRFAPSDEKLYSWWSYRNNDRRASNRGRRLDHILATPALSVHHEPSYRCRPARLEQGFGSRAGARQRLRSRRKRHGYHRSPGHRPDHRPARALHHARPQSARHHRHHRDRHRRCGDRDLRRRARSASINMASPRVSSAR